MSAIATFLLTSALYTQSVGLTPHGNLCEWGLLNVRGYKVVGSVVEGCVPGHQIDFGLGANSGAPQNSFLLQHKANNLNTQGVRATLSHYNGETVMVALISATAPQTEVIPDEYHSRHYTKLSELREEIFISVSGRTTPQLIFTYSTGGVIDASKTQVHSLSPLDASEAVFELDTRLSYNRVNDRSANSITVNVCTRRGMGNCYVYAPFGGAFGSASPEFSLGSTMPPGLALLRARYCVLPSNVSGAGYTVVCPGPVAL